MLPSETIKFFVVIFSLIKSGHTSAGNHFDWGYGGIDSPSQWQIHFPHCGGMKQSPVDIIKDDVRYNDELGELQLVGYNDMITTPPQLINNGHSAQVNIQGNFFIEAGGLPSQYRVEQFHFHWGDADRRGSEHYIDGESFPMEMHIVHYSTDYPNISAAIDQPNGLAVLSVFFEIGETDHTDFQTVIGHLHSTIHKDDVTQLEPFTLRSLLPEDVSTFYRYAGSLTTPPCYQSVIWTLFKDYVKISEKQISTFRTLLKSSAAVGGNDLLVNDFRPIQPLNSRVVETNEHETSGAIKHATTTLISLLVLNIIVIENFFTSINIL